MITSKVDVLNKFLYTKLQEIFQSVKISKNGELLDIAAKDLNEINIFNLGETYRVNCIFCRKYDYYDTNHHLWISYAWGTKQLSSLGNHVGIKCFRHDCLKNKSNLKVFYETIYGDKITNVRVKQNNINLVNTLNTNNKITHHDDILKKFKFDEIINHKDSEAYSYMLKKFKTEDAIKKICDRFSLKLCVDVMSDDLTDRYKVGSIYIPVVDVNNRITCEQWRLFNSKTKYFSGNNISKYIYNFNSVKDSNEIYFVEGPSDVWRLYLDGYDGLCLFGKNVSYEQRTLLEKYFGLFSTFYSQNELINKKFIVVLDGDVKDFEIVKYCRAIKRRVLGKVYLINLSNDLDPADLDDLRHHFNNKVEFID